MILWKISLSQNPSSGSFTCYITHNPDGHLSSPKMVRGFHPNDARKAYQAAEMKLIIKPAFCTSLFDDE